VRYASSELDLADAVGHGADVSVDPSRGGLAIMAGDLRPGRIVEAVRHMFGDASFGELNRRDQFAELEADSQNATQLRAWPSGKGAGMMSIWNGIPERSLSTEPRRTGLCIHSSCPVR